MRVDICCRRVRRVGGVVELEAAVAHGGCVVCEMPRLNHLAVGSVFRDVRLGAPAAEDGAGLEVGFVEDLAVALGVGDEVVGGDEFFE